MTKNILKIFQRDVDDIGKICYLCSQKTNKT